MISNTFKQQLENNQQSTVQNILDAQTPKSNINPKFLPINHPKYNEFQKYKDFYHKRNRIYYYNSSNNDINRKIINKTFMISDEEYADTTKMYKFHLTLKNQNGEVEELDITKDLCNKHCVRYIDHKMRLVNFSSVLQYIQELKIEKDIKLIIFIVVTILVLHLLMEQQQQKIMNNNYFGELRREASKARPANEKLEPPFFTRKGRGGQYKTRRKHKREQRNKKNKINYSYRLK